MIDCCYLQSMRPMILQSFPFVGFGLLQRQGCYGLPMGFANEINELDSDTERLSALEMSARSRVSQST